MKRYLLIYKESIKIAFAAASTYRMNFLLNSVIMLLGDILFPLITLLIYGSGAGFEGWTMYEVLLIQSVFAMSMAFANMTFNGIMFSTMNYVRDGNFEMVLLMPVDTMFLLMARTFSIDAVGSFIGGLTIFIIALSNIPAPSLLMWLQFGALFIIGLTVMMGTALLMAATSFKWVGNSRIPEIFDSMRSFGRYPQSIFPRAVITITSYLIPVAMIGYFPAATLLGQGNINMFTAIIPSILFMTFGILLYRSMVRLYQGVGG